MQAQAPPLGQFLQRHHGIIDAKDHRQRPLLDRALGDVMPQIEQQRLDRHVSLDEGRHRPAPERIGHVEMPVGLLAPKGHKDIARPCFA